MFVCLLTASCASTKFADVKPAERPMIQPPDSALTKLCGYPVELPSTPLVQKELERLWISDRKALITCAKRHKALADFIKQRDGALS